MDLEISTGEIRRGIRDYLADHDCLADVRSIADAGQSVPAHPPFDAAVWRGLACDLGTAALIVPEEYGGLGLGLRAAAGALFEAGHELYPGPLRSTASATAALADALAGASAQPDVAGALLAIATEGAVASLAVPAADVQGGCGVTLDGALLRGTARAVPHGASATILVAVADTPAGASLVLVQPAGLELAIRRPRTGIDFTTAYADLVLDGVPGTVISDDPRQVSHVLDLAQVLTAAEQVGTAAGALDRTLDYIKIREQFDRVIGGYQALQHRCADVAVHIEAAAALVERAAVAAEGGEDDVLAAAALLARAAASEVSLFAADTMVQLHGGIGFTWEHDAHFFFRHARSTAAWFGTIQRLRLEAARRNCLALITPEARE
jgi:alkylation response protein AidB-like acyl-CoA dehydrogenase